MGAKYEIDDTVYMKGRIVSSTSDETGTIYQVKFRSQDKMVMNFFEEKELDAAIPEPEPTPTPEPTKEKCAAVSVAGTIIKDSTITLSCATAGATIKYSVNNGEYAAYADGIAVSEDMTIKAYASADGYDDSEVSTFVYTVTEPDTTGGTTEPTTGDNTGDTTGDGTTDGTTTDPATGDGTTTGDSTQP